VFFSVANLGEVGTDRTTMPPCPHSRTNDTSEHAVLVRGAVSAPEMSLARVRHVFQGTTSALVYRYFLGKRDMARACPLVPLHRQGCPTAYVTEELKAIRIFSLSTGGTCKTSGLSRHVEPYSHHFITFKRHFPRGTLPS